ncbi:hypothetical protein N7489_004045 [Penicillium chrysogenum]|uniref:uncharacterized protein n=1 Tax=Penicillium chrysogenum TaxID=5076 RepID=UPI0024DF22F6|nr:uncharacterized protein N7489_004045 [Penicillium chrysogenum]KAJ5243949.1 hypothetical protein N7489_004045 [Penicillium chrysogenum]
MAAFQQPPSATLPPLSTTHRTPLTAFSSDGHLVTSALTSWIPRRLLNRSTTPKRGTPKMAPSAPH